MAESPLPTIADVVSWLDALLDPNRRDDYGPNGLQVDASPPGERPASARVASIVTGVTANLALIEAAAGLGADLLVVHHGLYWTGSTATATGALGRRLARCFDARLSVAAYHLPLDAHLEVGNAVGLARALGATGVEAAFPYKGQPTGVIARFEPPLDSASLSQRMAAISPRALLFPGGPPSVATVGIVTGGAPRLASEAAALGLDAYLTGECSEYTQATAREEGLYIGACGHHRSETFGPRQLASRLADAFPALDVRFIDVDNPA